MERGSIRVKSAVYTALLNRLEPEEVERGAL
jgi:hypothetical protein